MVTFKARDLTKSKSSAESCFLGCAVAVFFGPFGKVFSKSLSQRSMSDLFPARQGFG